MLGLCQWPQHVVNLQQIFHQHSILHFCVSCLPLALPLVRFKLNLSPLKHSTVTKNIGVDLF